MVRMELHYRRVKVKPFEIHESCTDDTHRNRWSELSTQFVNILGVVGDEDVLFLVREELPRVVLIGGLFTSLLDEVRVGGDLRFLDRFV